MPDGNVARQVDRGVINSYVCVCSMDTDESVVTMLKAPKSTQLYD
jgi:hypothetical protein